MTAFGPNLASSIAGAPQAERAQVQRANRESRDRARARETRKDERDAPVDQVEISGPVRNLKDNSQEETREDRQQNLAYGPPRPGARRPAEEPRLLDLEG
jgi:hypothetical protein